MSPSPFPSAPLGLGIFGEIATSTFVSSQAFFTQPCKQAVHPVSGKHGGCGAEFSCPMAPWSWFVVTSLSLIIIVAVPFLLVLWSHCRLFVNTLFLCTHSGHSILSSSCGGVENCWQVTRRVQTPSFVYQAPKPVQYEIVNEPSPLCQQGDLSHEPRSTRPHRSLVIAPTPSSWPWLSFCSKRQTQLPGQGRKLIQFPEEQELLQGQVLPPQEEQPLPKTSGPGLLFVGRFLITVSISVLVIGLFIFSISSWFSLGSCAFLRICPFLPRCPFYWCIVACSNLSQSFVFLQGQLLLPLFHF